MVTFPLKTSKENAAISPLFGKAKYFAFYDGVELKVEENPYKKGSELINWFLEKKVDTVVIQEMGTKPFEKISNSKLKVLFAGEGRVTTQEIVKKILNNELEELTTEQLEQIVKKHKGEKSESSCHSTNHDNKKNCHKKMKVQHKYVSIY
jgi:predicted Fe-Mo cluster-binding NifX family protein